MTKKQFIVYNPKEPAKMTGEFISPFQLSNSSWGFIGLKSSKVHEFGFAVYVGKEISENDLFAKIVDNKQKVLNVESLLSGLKKYLEQVAKCRLGDVYKLSTEQGIIGPLLVKTEMRPAYEKK